MRPINEEKDPKSTLPGFRDAIDSVPGRPAKITWDDYVSRPQDERDRIDLARQDYVLRGLRVPTREQALAEKLVRRTVSNNRLLTNSRRGLMVTAPPYFGKTELALHIARSIEIGYAASLPDYRKFGHVPVAWVEVAGNATGKTLLRSVAEFFVPGSVPPRSTTDQLLGLATSLLRHHHTRLLVIDEAHHLGGAEPSSFVKLIQNQSSATVVLCGVDLLSGSGFGTGQGKQVTSRCDIVRMSALDLEAEADSDWWSRWVKVFDRNLPLCDHQPGLLTANAGALHAATSGQLGRLAQLIETLFDDVLFDDLRDNELVTADRLWQVLDELRETTDVDHDLQRSKIVDARSAA